MTTTNVIDGFDSFIAAANSLKGVSLEQVISILRATNTTIGDANDYIISHMTNHADIMSSMFCDSIVNLKLIDPVKNPRVTLLGRATIGDGGQGIFYWDTTSTETGDDVLIVVKTGTATGRWKRIYTGGVHVEWYADFATCIAAIGSDDVTLETSSAIDLQNETVVIPSTTHLKCNNGTMFSNGTLTINGGFEAGDYQVFGDDIVVGGDTTCDHVAPIWFNDNDIQIAFDWALSYDIAKPVLIQKQYNRGTSTGSIIINRPVTTMKSEFKVIGLGENAGFNADSAVTFFDSTLPHTISPQSEWITFDGIRFSKNTPSIRARCFTENFLRMKFLGCYWWYIGNVKASIYTQTWYYEVCNVQRHFTPTVDGGTIYDEYFHDAPSSYDTKFNMFIAESGSNLFKSSTDSLSTNATSQFVMTNGLVEVQQGHVVYTGWVLGCKISGVYTEANQFEDFVFNAPPNDSADRYSRGISIDGCYLIASNSNKVITTGQTNGTGSSTITLIPDTTNFTIGKSVYVSAGMPSASTPYEILSKTSTSITLDTNAASVETGVEVRSAFSHIVFGDTRGGSVSNCYTNADLLNQSECVIEGISTFGNGINPSREEIRGFKDSVFKQNRNVLGFSKTYRKNALTLNYGNRFTGVDSNFGSFIFGGDLFSTNLGTVSEPVRLFWGTQIPGPDVFGIGGNPSFYGNRPFRVGSVMLNSEPSNGGWMGVHCTVAGDGTGANPCGVWEKIGQTRYRTVTSTPIGSLTPTRIGEEIFQSNTKVWYKSTGLTNVDWVALNS